MWASTESTPALLHQPSLASNFFLGPGPCSELRGLPAVTSSFDLIRFFFLSSARQLVVNVDPVSAHCVLAPFAEFEAGEGLET
jgi:hypothetical protein